MYACMQDYISHIPKSNPKSSGLAIKTGCWIKSSTSQIFQRPRFLWSFCFLKISPWSVVFIHIVLIFCYTFWHSSWEGEKATHWGKVSCLNVKEIMWKLCLSLLLIFLSPNLIIQPHLSERKTKKHGPEPDGLWVTITI